MQQSHCHCDICPIICQGGECLFDFSELEPGAALGQDVDFIDIHCIDHENSVLFKTK